MTFDIEAALSAGPQQGHSRCKLGNFLNDIPPETRNLQRLLDAVADPKEYPAARLRLSLSALGLHVGQDLIRDHRAGRCNCFLGA